MVSKNNFQTKELRILELKSSLNPQYERDQYTIEFEMHNETNQQSLGEGRDLAGTIRCKFKLSASDLNEENTYAIIEGVAVGVFTVDGSTDTDEFEKMLRINGMVTMLPMLRSSIFNVANTLTIRAPMIIPNVNVTAIQWND